MLLKLGNLICTHAGFAKFIHKKNTYMYTKTDICLEKSEYRHALRCTFTFDLHLRLVICWNLWNLFEI